MESNAMKLLNSQQAAEYLGISPRKLWGMKAGREIPYVQIGAKSIRYSIDHLDAWINQQTQGGTR